MASPASRLSTRFPFLSRLWPHQTMAVGVLEKYLRAFHRGSTQKAALVHLPTGAGKSGVIAVASRLGSVAGDVLVLSPRVALRRQLQADVAGRFFATALGLTDAEVGALPKAVRELAEKPAAVAFLPPAPTVFVATIQSLYSWHKRNEPVADALRKRVKLVIVDEGHCEPAPHWREALRAIPVPRVIFTATPFRNDLKLFDVDFDHACSLTHGEAVAGKFLRELKVTTGPRATGPQDFVKQLTAYYDRTFPAARRAAPAARPRVIVRCDNHDQIRQIAHALRADKRSCVAVHENFRRDPKRPWEFKHVPDPRNTDADFWVHQFKLMEGVDDGRFRLVAIYDEFRNSRELIQQAGRVLRNPGLKAGQVAHMLDLSGGEHGKRWANFRDYDRQLAGPGIKKLLGAAHALLEKWTTFQPALYFDGDFRAPFDFSTFDPLDDLRVPASANVYHLAPAKPLTAARAEALMGVACLDRDLLFRTWQVGPRTSVAVYIQQSNSPYLRRHFHLDTRLMASVVHVGDDHVFVYDPGMVFPRDAPGLGRPVPAADLKKLFPASGRLTGVTVRNSNLARDAIRSRSFTAYSVSETLPFPDDQASVCTTVEGYGPGCDGLTRRYVGLQSARVSDYGSGLLSLDDYVGWVEHVAAQLGGRGRPPAAFTRYAPEAAAPRDCTPTHLLLDVSEVADRFVVNAHPVAPPDQPIDVEDLCLPVAGGECDVVANGHPFRAQVRYDPAQARYELVCPELDESYRPTDRGGPDGLTAAVNAAQSFRILPATPGYYYTLGQFHRPGFQFGPNYDDDAAGLLKVLVAVAGLGTIGSEKGEGLTRRAGSWPKASVFGLIDDLGRGTTAAGVFGTPDIVVCDDLGTEAADFILADTRSLRVVFAHAKAEKTASHCSAKNLQEVFAQAVKNRHYLYKFGDHNPPPGLKRWGKEDWSRGGLSLKRIRRGPKSGADAWHRIRTVIRDPRSTCEVWAVLGQILSMRAFEAQLRQRQPEAEAVQAAYLLHSTVQAMNAIGAKFKVLCSP